MGRIDAACLNLWLSRKQAIINSRTDRIHANKLRRLGASPLSQNLDVNKVIFNYSNYSLSKDEKRILLLGLDFGLPITRLNYYKYFLDFEKLYQVINKLPIYNYIANAKEQFRSQIKSIANKFYFGFKFCPHNSPMFAKKDFKILNNLRKNENLYITKPDKGNGVVLMNRKDYESKMSEILNDHSKFSKVTHDEKKLVLKLEDKLNNILRSVKDTGAIALSMYNSCYASGSRLGYLYGLPKVYKDNLPLRPILSACSTYYFNLSKAIIPFISELSLNDYILKNSVEFVNSISNIPNADQLYMCSFDIQSLYTNVPVIETMNIIIDKLFTTANSLFNGFNIKQFRNILDICFRNSYFKFGNSVYQQLDGLSMGGPVSPVAANIFLNHFETTVLTECPTYFKPVFYRRYLDDTFLLFNNADAAQQFFTFINNKHPNISFTFEGEQNGCLNFLDVTVTKINNCFTTSVFRKKTFTGLGLNYFSNIFSQYKVSTIMTLINRAFTLTSSYQNFHNEIEYLREFFINNMYPEKLFNTILKKFLNHKFITSPPCATVQKQSVFVSIPYIGTDSAKLRSEILSLLSKFYPQIQPKLYFKNNFKIGSFFRKCNVQAPMLQSSVVYKYTCDLCEEVYIGSTKLQLFCRSAQHFGVSHRTATHSSKPTNSAIKTYSETHDHLLKLCNFSILDSCHNLGDLRLLETVYINKLKPQMNKQQDSGALNIVT